MKLAIAVLVMLGGCSIDHRTDSLKCGSSSDCSDGRTCDLDIGGYCVTSGSSSTMCPAECASCDFTQATPTCTIASGGSVQCPSGFFCDITCGGSAGNCSAVTCGDDGCDVTCTSAGACGGTISCPGNGPCQIDCQTSGACSGIVTCTNSCKCDMTCTGTGACGGVQNCPKHGATRCTTDGSPLSPCDSSSSASCDQCQ